MVSAAASASTVSVVIANYNHADFIGEALAALAAQTRLPDEIIVVDDCSTDHSLEVLAALCDRMPMLKVLRNERNLGAVAAFRRGVEAAMGEYVYFAGADDRVLPELIEKSVGLLEANPRAELCFSQGSFFGDGARRWVGADLGSEPVYFEPMAFARASALPLFDIPTWTMVFRRESFLKWGGLRVDFGWNCDWFITYVLGLTGGACYIPQALAQYRITVGAYGARSVSEPHTQMEFMAKIMDELAKPDYDGIRRGIRTSGFLGHFPYALRTILAHPRHRGFLSWPLLKNNLFSELRIVWSRILPMSLRRWLKSILFGRHASIGTH